MLEWFRHRPNRRVPALLAVLALLAGAFLLPGKSVAHAAASIATPWEAAAFCGEQQDGAADHGQDGEAALLCCLGGICAGQACPMAPAALGLPQPVVFAGEWAGRPAGDPVFPPKHFASTLKSRAPPRTRLPDRNVHLNRAA